MKYRCVICPLPALACFIAARIAKSLPVSPRIGELGTPPDYGTASARAGLCTQGRRQRIRWRGDSAKTVCPNPYDVGGPEGTARLRRPVAGKSSQDLGPWLRAAKMLYEVERRHGRHYLAALFERI